MDLLDEKRFQKASQKETLQSAVLENRKKLTLSGIQDVDAFDEESITLITEDGTLTVQGSELHIQKLSVETGDVAIEGRVDSLSYSDGETGRKGMGFFARLFR